MSDTPIKLFQFPRMWGRNISPFTLKLETWLRLAGLPFEVIEVRNPRIAPKGKLPFIEDQGERIGDSTLIIEHLKRTRGVDLDQGLDHVTQAEALALQRLFEDHFAFILSYSRWIDREGWRTFRPEAFAGLRAGLRQVAPYAVREMARRQLRAQGLGRHRQDEIYGLARADLEAVSVVLNEGPFFFLDRPTTIDAIAYGFLANVLLVPVESELKRIAMEFGNLRAFCHVMEQHLGDHAPAAGEELREPAEVA